MDADTAKSTFSNFQDKAWRVHQREAAEWAANSNKRFPVIEAGTGAGKSLMAMTIGAMAGEANYLCGTKSLQQQIATDFPEARTLWGRSNYRCTRYPSRTCEDCTHSKAIPCFAKDKCGYRVAKKLALESNLRILNYSYYLSETQYAGMLSGSPLTIVDEADSLESVLIGHISLEFSERALYRLGLKDGPGRKTTASKAGIGPWVEFGQEAYRRSLRMAKEFKIKLDGCREEDELADLKKEYDYFTHLHERCQMFVDNVDRTWLMEDTLSKKYGKLTFRPLWITEELAEQFMWRHAEKFVMLSASFLPMPVFAQTLGIPYSEIDYLEIPSTFPVERRPIHIAPVANVTNKTMDTEAPKIFKMIKIILDHHKGEKGLIHSTSFRLAQDVMEYVQDERLISHGYKDRQQELERFKASTRDDVMVSPSMDRGIDLPYDQCKFIICLKMPFFSLGDKVTSSRLYSGDIGKLWYEATAMKSIQQACGRGMRAEDDEVVCYLLDKQIERIYLKKPSLWPESFREAISWNLPDWVQRAIAMIQEGGKVG